jgi:methylaspartate ammonia-lyase
MSDFSVAGEGVAGAGEGVAGERAARECFIADVLAAPAEGAFFFDDQAAIKAGAAHDGFAILGPPLTPGFAAVREPAEAVSVMIRLSDGHVAHGDCVAVQYSGVGGRDPLLRSAALVTLMEGAVADTLRGRPVSSFRELSTCVDELMVELPGFGTAAAYGLSQALLAAAAHGAGQSMAGVIQREWGLDAPMRPVPVYAQCGEQRYDNVDKMILREVDSLPHGLINNPTLVGEDGGRLVEYVAWVSRRIRALRRRADYAPVLHFDVYGVIGLVTAQRTDRMADVLIALEEAARPFALRVEHPLDAGDRAGQIEQMALLRRRLAERGSRVQLVADEWANTVEDIREFNRAGAADMIQIKTPDLGGLHHTVDAVLDCRQHGVLAHIGGSCCESDRSARVCVHVALATGADQILAKPGMGVDEGLSIVANEMSRTLRLQMACAPAP